MLWWHAEGGISRADGLYDSLHIIPSCHDRMPRELSRKEITSEGRAEEQESQVGTEQGREPVHCQDLWGRPSICWQAPPMRLLGGGGSGGGYWFV